DHLRRGGVAAGTRRRPSSLSMARGYDEHLIGSHGATGVREMGRIILIGLLTLVAGAAPLPRVGGRAAAPAFPDVPRWHWAHEGVQRGQDAGILRGYPAAAPELVQNAVFQIYDGFAHAGATAAQAWVERFTYNRPANWPQPLQRSRIMRFALRDLRTA